MNKTARVAFILAVFFFICPALGQADIVYTRNGDKLFGVIQNPSFSVQTPYGKIRVENQFLKSIRFQEGSVRRWVMETINNDQFSGSLLNDSIQLIQEDGKPKKLTKETIKRIRRECGGPSRPAITTIVTMKNNDRFSGKFLDPTLDIRTNAITRSVQCEDINRLEFVEDYQAGTKILLENGDLITGTLKQNHFRLAPDSIPELTLTKASITSIQFNAPKMILNAFNGSVPINKDSDGDRIPDYADLCMDTPAGVGVGQDGCPRGSMVAQTLHKERNNHQTSPQNSPGSEVDLSRNILFDFDRTELKPNYYPVLDEAATKLSRNPHTQAAIHGHTDNVGTAEYNQDLSEKRALEVKNYFVRKGVAKDRLFPRGFGFKVNAATNDSETGRALNRRVEIILLPDQKTIARRQSIFRSGFKASDQVQGQGVPQI